LQTLLILLVCIFAGLALLVFVAERFGATSNPETTARIQRWILPLVGLLLVLSAIRYFFGPG
jgi:threonine/homoserine/homoserine lactone efflux protein